jgi:hypothetical protein
MNKNTRNLLIAGGVVVAAYLVYNQMKKAKAQKALAAAKANAGVTPVKQSFGGNTGSGFWGSLFG